MSKNMNDNSTQGPSSQSKPLKCESKHNSPAPTIGIGTPDTVFPPDENPANSQAHQDRKTENSFQITNVEVGSTANPGTDISRQSPCLPDDFAVLTEVLVIPDPIPPSVRHKSASVLAPSIVPTISTQSPTTRKIKPNSGIRFQIIKTLPLLDHSTRTNTTKAPKHSGRFKVVKFESTEPFQRGRWTCMDFLDKSVNQQSTVKKVALSKPELTENLLEDVAEVGAEKLEIRTLNDGNHPKEPTIDQPEQQFPLKDQRLGAHSEVRRISPPNTEHQQEPFLEQENQSSQVIKLCFKNELLSSASSAPDLSSFNTGSISDLSYSPTRKIPAKISEIMIGQSKSAPIPTNRYDDAISLPLRRTFSCNDHVGLVTEPCDDLNPRLQPATFCDSASNSTLNDPLSVQLVNFEAAAGDKVETDLMSAACMERDVLKERVVELMDRLKQLEIENRILKANATQEVLEKLPSPGREGLRNINPILTTTVSTINTKSAATSSTITSSN